MAKTPSFKRDPALPRWLDEGIKFPAGGDNPLHVDSAFSLSTSAPSTKAPASQLDAFYARVLAAHTRHLGPSKRSDDTIKTVIDHGPCVSAILNSHVMTGETPILRIRHYVLEKPPHAYRFRHFCRTAIHNLRFFSAVLALTAPYILTAIALRSSTTPKPSPLWLICIASSWVAYYLITIPFAARFQGLFHYVGNMWPWEKLALACPLLCMTYLCAQAFVPSLYASEPADLLRVVILAPLFALLFSIRSVLRARPKTIHRGLPAGELSDSQLDKIFTGCRAVMEEVESIAPPQIPWSGLQ